MAKAWTKADWKRSYFIGLAITLADIKAVLFYASLLPLVAPLQDFRWSDFAALGLITVLSVGGAKLAIAFGLRRLFKGTSKRDGSRHYGRMLNKGCGGALVCAGTYLATKT